MIVAILIVSNNIFVEASIEADLDMKQFERDDSDDDDDKLPIIVIKKKDRK